MASQGGQTSKAGCILRNFNTSQNMPAGKKRRFRRKNQKTGVRKEGEVLRQKERNGCQLRKGSVRFWRAWLQRDWRDRWQSYNKGCSRARGGIGFYACVEGRCEDIPPGGSGLRGKFRGKEVFAALGTKGKLLSGTAGKRRGGTRRILPVARLHKGGGGSCKKGCISCRRIVRWGGSGSFVYYRRRRAIHRARKSIKATQVQNLIAKKKKGEENIVAREFLVRGARGRVGVTRLSETATEPAEKWGK